MPRRLFLRRLLPFFVHISFEVTAILPWTLYSKSTYDINCLGKPLTQGFDPASPSPLYIRCFVFPNRPALC